MATPVEIGSDEGDVALGRSVTTRRLSTEKYDSDSAGTDVWPLLRASALLILGVALVGWILT